MKLSDFKRVPTRPDEFIKYLIERLSRVLGAHIGRNESHNMALHFRPSVKDLSIPSIHVLKDYLSKSKVIEKDCEIINILIHCYSVMAKEASCHRTKREKKALKCMLKFYKVMSASSI